MISEILKNKIRSYYSERVKYATDMGYTKYTPYKVEFTNHKSYVGLCDYNNRTIFVSELHVRHMTWEGITDLINHELAHWIERKDSHGPYWKSMAVKMGANPSHKVHARYMSRKWLIMFNDEIIGSTDEKLSDISKRYATRRKKETIGKLYYKLNCAMIDNMNYGE